MQVNYLQILQAIRNGQNPQQLIMEILEGELSNTPMGNKLLQLVKQNRVQEIEQIARNLCEQQGKNFDEEFASFKQSLGYKK